MRLMKKGTPKDQTFRGECRTCGSVYEADRSELKVEDGGQREPGEFAHATCQVCKELGRNEYNSLILYPLGAQ